MKSSTDRRLPDGASRSGRRKWPAAWRCRAGTGARHGTGPQPVLAQVPERHAGWQERSSARVASESRPPPWATEAIRRPVDVEADVVVASEQALAGMETHPDADLASPGHSVAASDRWRRRPPPRRRRVAEHDEEGVPGCRARRPHVVEGPEQRMMLLQEVAIGRDLELGDQTGRAPISLNRNVMVPDGRSARFMVRPCGERSTSDRPVRRRTRRPRPDP
jgi:hypothetical protein